MNVNTTTQYNNVKVEIQIYNNKFWITFTAFNIGILINLDSHQLEL